MAGFLLARRSPAGQILVRCGISAALFGAAFGEFFGIHGLLPAPLRPPLEQPLVVLALSLAIGAGLLLLGLVFSGIEALWQDQLRHWTLEGAPVLAIYLSLLLATGWSAFLVAAAAAVVWYVAGAIALSRSSGMRCVVGRLGHLLEATLQLAINTLSFLRVAAFALAHSALSLMVVELVSAIDSLVLRAFWFVLGQMLIIVLEGMVVSVQITRLMLFEFFVRFLRLEGRPYRPMPKPPERHAPRSSRRCARQVANVVTMRGFHGRPNWIKRRWRDLGTSSASVSTTRRETCSRWTGSRRTSACGSASSSCTGCTGTRATRAWRRRGPACRS
jgi:V/A-type H+-transporting ATPase subunit I